MHRCIVTTLVAYHNMVVHYCFRCGLDSPWPFTMMTQGWCQCSVDAAFTPVSTLMHRTCIPSEAVRPDTLLLYVPTTVINNRRPSSAPFIVFYYVIHDNGSEGNFMHDCSTINSFEMLSVPKNVFEFERIV